MTNGDREGQILLSHPHTNNGFFSCYHQILPYFILEKHEKKLLENPAIWWRNLNITISLRIDVRPACVRRAAVAFDWIKVFTKKWSRLLFTFLI